MDKIELSIVIVNLNTVELTVGCIRSIEKQAKNLSFELLLIDNGSTDGSVKALQKIKNEKYWKNKFTLILNDSNLGYGKANNQGIKVARGKFVLLLNNDTLILENSLQTLLSFAKQTPDAGVVASQLLNQDKTIQPSVYHFPTILSAIKENWFQKKGLFDKYFPTGQNPTLVDSVVGAVFLITPKALKRVGVLNEKYFNYFEDIDYCRSIWKSGLKVYYLPASKVIHFHGATFKLYSEWDVSWRKLIPSSKIYHGVFRHYVIFGVMWLGQKWQKLFG